MVFQGGSPSRASSGSVNEGFRISGDSDDGCGEPEALMSSSLLVSFSWYCFCFLTQSSVLEECFDALSSIRVGLEGATDDMAGRFKPPGPEKELDMRLSLSEYGRGACAGGGGGGAAFCGIGGEAGTHQGAEENPVEEVVEAAPVQEEEEVGDLVQLGQSLGSGWSTGLDLAGSQTNSNVGDGGVLGLTRSVGHHDTPAGGVGVGGGLDGLGQSTDLVDLEQQGVGGLLLDGNLDSLWIGHGQVVSNNLDLGLGVEVGPSLPVVLGEWVLHRHNWVVLDQLDVQVGQLLTGEPLGRIRVWVLEVQVVLSVVVELGGGRVQGNADLAGVASSLNGVDNEVQGLLWSGEVWSNTSLVTDVTGTLAVLLLGQGLEVVVNFRTNSETLGEGRSTGWNNHELLESQGATGVRTSVQNVLERNRQHKWLWSLGDVADVLVQWNTLVGSGGLGSRKRHSENGIGSQFALVFGSVQRKQELVEFLLVQNRNLGLNDSRCNDVVDIGNSLQNTLTKPLGLVTISQFQGLVDTSTGSRRNNRTEKSLIGGQVHLHSWVSSGVPVPGDSPLLLCEASNRQLLTLSHVDLSPNPPVRGNNLTIVARGALSTEITDGAYVEVDVSYGYIKLLHQTYDICEELPNVDMECPLEKGYYDLVKEVEIPNEVPPGKYTVVAKAYTAEDELITCLTGTAEFPPYGVKQAIEWIW
ncbi:hypothetical protein OGAPHI_002997 [Ogataea philodendri]|uniref:Phosphatidylglycerol/phosphatidylinositol transfer protein n=1 Tax=Ogataea philodendri TaxID=1378263 RepID=A0A9P8P868_9ASCO|nr:uncharacterized protein OGAPHI_002997 [Ogataea philodendri]KAH3667348.1 hypothetical protein OGAPHI_002997 [Ogataea philodendri]